MLDTRQRAEHDSERIPGALNIPLQELPDQIPHLPAGPLWVHCASGYRASIGASLIARAGSYAVGTSLFVVTCNSLFALLPRLAAVPLNFAILIPCVTAALIGTVIGKRLGTAQQSAALHAALAGLIAALSVWVGIDAVTTA